MRLIDIHRDERLKVALAWALNGLLAAGHAIGWAALLALLVKRLGVAALPWAYVFANFLGLAASFVYLRYADAVRRDHALVRSALILGGVLLGAWLLFLGPGKDQTGLTPVLGLFFAAGIAAHGVGKSTLKAQLWTIFNDIFRPSQGKRVYPLITTAKAAGGFLGGVLVAPLTNGFGISACIFAWGASVLLVVPLTWVMVRAFGAELQGGKPRPGARAEAAEPDETPPSLREGLRYCVRSPLVGLLALIALAYWIGNQLHDFQYTQIMDHEFKEAESLGALFGYYTAGFNVTCFLLQIFVAPRVLSRLGVGRSLLIQPLTGLAGFGAVLWSFTFLPGLFLRAVWDLAEDTIQHSAFQLAFNAVPANWRGRARGFVEGIVNPLGGMFGGIAIIAITVVGGVDVGEGADASDHRWMTLAGLLASGVFLALAWRARHVYVRAAIENLDTSDRRTRLDSIEALEERGHPLAIARLDALAASGDLESRRVALRCLARLRLPATFGHIEKLFDDADAALRATALHTARAFHRSVARHHPDEWEGVLRRARVIVEKDDDPRVRAEAAHLLLESADGPRATALIRELLDDDTAEVRVRVVGALASLRLPGIEDSLRPYLNDPRPVVRAATAAALWRARPSAQTAGEAALAAMLAGRDAAELRCALTAAARLPTAKFAPAFAAQLNNADAEIRALAAMAFLATGLAAEPAWPRAVDELARALIDGAREPLLRAHLVPLFGELSADALDALIAASAAQSPEQREQAARILRELYPALLKSLAPA